MVLSTSFGGIDRISAKTKNTKTPVGSESLSSYSYLFTNYQIRSDLTKMDPDRIISEFEIDEAASRGSLNTCYPIKGLMRTGRKSSRK